MAEWTGNVTSGLGVIVQFAASFIAIAMLLRVVATPRARWNVNWKGWRGGNAPPWWLRTWRADAPSVALQERKLLLAGCGIRYSPASYLAHRRSLLAILPAIAGGIYVMLEQGAISGMFAWNSLFAALVGYMAAWSDRTWLQAFRRYRTDRIRREIVAVSSQLLYYAGSRLHLHGKLMKCLPLTRQIRFEMGLLLNEWYHDADTALKRFKERLGTDEAYGFAESLRSLRLNESEEIYDLLREVLRDYKEQIRLAKEGRKETTSYVLFVLAGIPILYTFQIFLYPWVQETGKLFDALNP
ncbi:hypothetical protein ACFPPD_07740 [Cohnella suwonensis]|uniref:Type II secretion system protein GspF domain-containing protein n=1 Tax=Cohnella suwonensis TaxID=696072 RepID=A0ABW0LTL9_9BACL